MQGQYESNEQERLSLPPSPGNSTQRDEINQRTLSSEDLQAVREGLARAKRSFVSEESEANRGDNQQAMRVVDEALARNHETQQYIQPLPHDNRPYQPYLEANRHPQVNVEVNNQPQPRYEANRPDQPQEYITQPQNSHEDQRFYMPDDPRQSHLKQPSPHEGVRQSQNLAEIHHRQNMPEEARQQQTPHAEGPRQPHILKEDPQRQYMPEETPQHHFRQVQAEEAFTRPQPQENSIGHIQRTSEDHRLHRVEDDHNYQQTLDQLYIQHMNLERNNYHREQQVVEKEIEQREMLERQRKEELWKDQRRQTHAMQPQEQNGTPQHHYRMPDSGMEQWEGRSHYEEPQHVEFIPYDERHPAWTNQRLPRGVNPNKYYIIHNDL